MTQCPNNLISNKHSALVSYSYLHFRHWLCTLCCVFYSLARDTTNFWTLMTDFEFSITDGTKQNVFSVEYGAWLTQLFNSTEVRQYLLNEYQISLDTVLKTEINQNSADGSPYFSIDGVAYHQLDEFFGDQTAVMIATGKTTQERYYASSFELPNPYGDNPFVIELADDTTVGDDGVDGVDGISGVDGADGAAGAVGFDKLIDGIDGVRGADAVGSGAPGQRRIATDGSDATSGTAGDDGDDGSPGEIGTAGGDGTDGQSGTTGVVLDPLMGYTSLVINSTGTANVIVGGNGGSGGVGGAGGDGGSGGAGGDGGDGSDGGDGGDGGNGDTSNNFRDGGDGGDAGSGGDGGAGGAGGDAANGMSGGSGGDGGDGAVAINNGLVNKVFILGDANLTILGGKGGEGGAGGLGGSAGLAGLGGEGGDGGDAGIAGDGGSATGSGGNAGAIGVDGAAGVEGNAGVDGDDGLTGTAGVTGAAGQDGQDATGFSNAVVVDATAFTGYLTISGSNEADTMFMGSGGSTIYSTLGADAYTLRSGADTLVYSSLLHSSGTFDVISGFGATDKIDISALVDDGESWNFTSTDDNLVTIAIGADSLQLMFSDTSNLSATSFIA
jgi:hypothetical protein